MKKVILSSILVLALCASLITGATFALFTSDSTTNIAATSGKVEVVATLDKAENDWVYSPTSISTAEGNDVLDATNAADTVNGVFSNQGNAVVDGATVTMNGVTPGDKVNLVVKIDNRSDVAIKYRAVISDASGALAGVMAVTIDGVEYNGAYNTTWLYAEPGEAIDDMKLSIALPTTAEAQGENFAMTISIVAVQANADTTEDNTAAQAGTLSELAEFLKEASANGAGKDVTIQLSQNFEVAEGESWSDLCEEVVFAGVKSLTIEGMGHTISGLDAPLIAGRVGGTMTIKNLTLDNANIVKPGYNGLGVGAFLGYTDVAGDVMFDGCTVSNSTIICTTDASAGGFVGNFSSSNKLSFIDCSVNNCDIQAVSNAGGFVGLTFASKTTVSGCEIIDARITATEEGASWRVGYVAGTMNNTTAENVFSNVTVGGDNASLNMTNPGANNVTDNRNGAYCNLFGRVWASVNVNGTVLAANQK